MDNLFDSLKTLMYEYNHLEELTPRKKNTVLDTYSRFSCDYEFVDQLVPAVDAEEIIDEEE